MFPGKMIRLSRLTCRDRMLCVPLDHGITDGPIGGLRSIFRTIERVEEGGATAVVLHKGIVRLFVRALNLGIIVHFSASTKTGPNPDRKVIVSTIKQAIRLGADAISIHVNTAVKYEAEMLIALGMLSEECDETGLPLLAMMYPKRNSDNPREPYAPEEIAHVARIGAELGADIVKTVYTGNPESFKQVVESCPVPVVIAGGPKCENDKAILDMAAGAIQAGAMGVSFGRNVFLHDNPKGLVRALFRVVVEDCPVEQALETLRE